MASQNCSAVGDDSWHSSPVHQVTKFVENRLNVSEKRNKGKGKRAMKDDDSSPNGDLPILNGIVEFGRSHRNRDMIDFLEQRLGGGFSKSEIKAKVRAMRKKYRRMKKNKKEIAFKTSHEARVFELSESVWDDVSNLDNEENVADDEVKRGGEYVFLKDFLGTAKSFGMSDAMAETMITMLSPAEAKKLNLRSKELSMKEIKIYIKKLELMKEMNLKILDVMQKK